MFFQFKQFFKSSVYAFDGLKYAFKNEQNFRLQIFFAVLAFAASWYCHITIKEWAVIILVVIIVLTLELINTMFEYLSDVLEPRIHHYVKQIKNIMAATVLLASIGAFAIGALIFWPYIVQ